MNKVRPVSSLREEAIYRPIIAKYLAEIDRLRELMRLDDIKIAHSQARTWEILAEIKAMRSSPGAKQ